MQRVEFHTEDDGISLTLCTITDGPFFRKQGQVLNCWVDEQFQAVAVGQLFVGRLVLHHCRALQDTEWASAKCQ